jgi:hypothetical protein
VLSGNTVPNWAKRVKASGKVLPVLDVPTLEQL